MSDLARRSKSSGSRVLLVRQPVRSVGSSLEDNPLPLRLAVGVIVALGVLLAAWLLGTLGFHLGFAPTLRGVSLETPAGGGFLVLARMLITLPTTILRAGMAEPLWLMLGFVAIAIPAGALGAVRPASPGGPRPHVLTVTFSYTAAILGGIFALLVMAWAVSPIRSDLIQPLPGSVDAMRDWLSALRLAAGLDVLAVIAMSLWVVLVMKITVPRWLRGLIAGIAFPVLVIATVAMAMSNVTVSEMNTGRTAAKAFEGATAERVLVLGAAHSQLATLRISGQEPAIELIEHPARMRVVARQSIIEFLAD